MLWERQEVSEHNREALGHQPVCACEHAVLSVQVTVASDRDRAWSLHRNFTFYFIQEGGKKQPLWPKLHTKSLLFYKSLHCADARPMTSQQACNSQVHPFESLSSHEDVASTLPHVIPSTPFHTFILDESYVKAFLSQGTVLSWEVGSIRLYTHLIKNI